MPRSHPPATLMKPAAFLLFTCLLPLAAADEATDFRYKFEVLARDIPQPMTMEMAPDGRIFFHEIGGRVRLIDPQTREIREVGSITVTTEQENGLIGMTLDPAFGENGWIYFMHSPPDMNGQIVSRFTIENDLLMMASRKDLLQWEEQRRECCHHAGALRFGPDGNLYLSTGDNTHPFGDSGSYAPIDEREDRGPWDAQKSSANTNDLRGKILRIRPTPEGGYTIPEGNLFKPGTPQTRAEIFAMGFRNPWRFSVDPKTGIVYVGDVGPDAGSDSAERGPRGYDTISQLRGAANLGWPYARGGRAYRDFDFATQTPREFFNLEKPRNDSPNNDGLDELPPVQDPLIWYPGGTSEQFPELGSGGRTACAGPVFHYDPKFAETGGLPETFDGCLLFWDWNRPFIKWARLGADAELVGIEDFTAAARVALGGPDTSGRFQIKRPVDAFFGPDGCLYLLDYGETWGVNADSSLIKVSYQRGNLDPIARASAENTQGREPHEVKLMGNGSSDPEGQPLTYEWRLLPGGNVIATTADALVTLNDPGNFIAELRVTDPEGGTSVASLPLTVGNTPPQVRFTSPMDGDFFTPGTVVPYALEVTDAEDGSSADAATAEKMALQAFLSATWLGIDGKAPETPTGMTLMKQSTCFNCHAVEQALIGPPLVAIAEKYRGQGGAIDTSVERVLKGSAGVWGQLPMLPHPQHTSDELHMMVSWIYSLETGKTGPAMLRGLSGELIVPDDTDLRSGVLEASFIDAGRGTVEPLAGTATLRLRSRTVEAELAEGIHGPMLLEFGNASGRRGIGAIDHGHHIRLAAIPLDATSAVRFRVASAGSGGVIELREQSADGRLLASVTVEPTGDWDRWVELEAPLEASGSRKDLVVRFVNEGKGGLMNLDWIRFEPR